MNRATGRYRNQTVELDKPLVLADGTEVEILVHVVSKASGARRAQCMEQGLSRLDEEWDNPEDAIYDDWKKLYGA